MAVLFRYLRHGRQFANLSLAIYRGSSPLIIFQFDVGSEKDSEQDVDDWRLRVRFRRQVAFFRFLALYCRSFRTFSFRFCDISSRVGGRESAKVYLRACDVFYVGGGLGFAIYEYVCDAFY